MVNFKYEALTLKKFKIITCHFNRRTYSLTSKQPRFVITIPFLKFFTSRQWTFIGKLKLQNTDENNLLNKIKTAFWGLVLKELRVFAIFMVSDNKETLQQLR